MHKGFIDFGVFAKKQAQEVKFDQMFAQAQENMGKAGESLGKGAANLKESVIQAKIGEKFMSFFAKKKPAEPEIRAVLRPARSPPGFPSSWAC